MYNLKDESSNDRYVEYITSIVHSVYTKMYVGKTEVKLQVDSGASVNVIHVSLGANKKFESTTKTLQSWNDTTLKPLGSCRLALHNQKNKKFLVEFLVVERQLTPLTGANYAAR